MPDEQNENQDNSTDPQDTGQDQGENLQDDQTGDSGEDVKFNKTQLQQISSIMGSIIKKQIDENVTPLIETSTVRQSPDATDVSNPGVRDKFSADLLDQALSGDFFGAVEKAISLRNRADANLSETRKTELVKDSRSYEDKPYYNDVKLEMDRLAAEAAAKGYPAKPANELAYNTAVREHLEKKYVGNIDEGSLQLETGGRYTPASKGKAKLPPQFEEAYQRDKAKGHFKNRQEFLDNLSPQVRAQYEI
ncbi:MAG: hypothetical protein ACYTEU_12930 [Planctomycetota bacterium]|jgi:hypothetical protein